MIQHRMRMLTLSEMLHVCLARMNATQRQTMRENLTAMSDLSDDENSPRHQVPENQFLVQVQQTHQAYEIGLSRVRRGIRIQPDSPNQSFEDEEEDVDRYAHSN